MTTTKTVVTSVMVPREHKEIRSGQIVERISNYLDKVDQEEVAARVVRTAVIEFIRTGRWQNRTLDNRARIAKIDDVRRSVRISESMLERIQKTAKSLDLRQGDVIRSAIADCQFDVVPATRASADVNSKDFERRLKLLNISDIFGG